MVTGVSEDRSAFAFMVKQTMKMRTALKRRYEFAVYSLLCLKLDWGGSKNREAKEGMGHCYWWSLVRDQITDMLSGWIDLRLAELIINLLEFERNVYWRTGSRLMCHAGWYRTQVLETSRV